MLAPLCQEKNGCCCPSSEMALLFLGGCLKNGLFEVLSIDILFGGILQVLSLAISNQGDQIEKAETSLAC